MYYIFGNTARNSWSCWRNFPTQFNFSFFRISESMGVMKSGNFYKIVYYSSWVFLKIMLAGL